MNLQMTKPKEVAMHSKNNELANVASLLENLQQLSMNNSSSIAASPPPALATAPYLTTGVLQQYLSLLLFVILKKIVS